MLLRSMQQAIYTHANAGHFGLAYAAYTHFTSPIRRYPDLLVHRVIKAILLGKRYGIGGGAVEATAASAPAAKTLRKGSRPAKAPTSAQDAALWEAAGAHCSANERRADEASRDVEAWLKCRFMRDHLGEEYAGTVGTATSFGLFVTLDQLYVEGLVHITELGGEYFRFDEVRQELRGERSGVRYGVGSRVRVQVSRVDLDGRKIDFRLVREGETDALVARKTVTGKSATGKPATPSDELQQVKGRDRAAKAARAKAVAGRGTAAGKKTRGSAKTAKRSSRR
jgi:ribonuclease R